MKLRTFLTHRSKQQPLTVPVTYFFGDEYPLLFCANFLRNFKAQEATLKTVTLDHIDWQQLQANLNTTFLGQTQTFWLGNISELNSQVKKKILDYLADYIGPHKVICFVSTKDAPEKNNALVSLNDPLEKNDLEKIFQFFWPVGTERFLRIVKSHRGSLCLDKVVLLAQYSKVLGDNSELFMRDWYEKVVLPEESLFTLAQSLFARKQDLFFRSWNGIKDEYAAPFWTTFWSEQLWRAHHVIKFRKEGKFNEAKRMSYRLPFSFMQREWQHISLEELSAAHEFLYQTDRLVKSGGSMLALEIFYIKFMSKQF